MSKTPPRFVTMADRAKDMPITPPGDDVKKLKLCGQDDAVLMQPATTTEVERRRAALAIVYGMGGQPIEAKEDVLKMMGLTHA
ncbi:hypothetical protein VVR12_01640 [Rothia sp. LK2588]|uniref:hypothetical protein n=1 Tax=Rothia sp. LK2588 TaxID=3114369 RepID=UPI0034CF6EE7